MPLDLSCCQFVGPALPSPFVRFELENELRKAKLLPKTTGAEGQKLADRWEIYRRKLRELVLRAGSLRVQSHVIEPLLEHLGYAKLEEGGQIQTREGPENGGMLLVSADGTARLRTWSVDLETDLDAPARRGWAFRYSHVRIAQRVLLAAGERVGLVTNGSELRLLISDPARPDSQVIIPIDPQWKRSRDPHDCYLLLLALGSPAGVKALPDLIDKARLQQTRVTKDLRKQARQAIEGFVQEVLDHPGNRQTIAAITDRQKLAKDLWHEGLILIYRLLFILKLESSDDPARAFSFASSSLWRNSFSPSLRLAQFAQAALAGQETGQLLEQGLRTLFRMFTEGLQSSELHVAPLGGTLFGEAATPLLARLHWGERAVACVLDKLLWTPKRRGVDARERVHYGSLDVEDLGRVYEALLELDAGIATETMCRLRRQKLEVVVPVAQGVKYRPQDGSVAEAEEEQDDDGDASDDADDEVQENGRGKKTKVKWIEEIPPNRFYLRVGLGRKASGAYYTPHSFVRFLVQETLGPQLAEHSPKGNPNPGEILKLKVLDPAMGSGHFLVEVCRFLGAALYEACRLCDEKASALERKAEGAKNKDERDALSKEAMTWRQRIIDLPDPDDVLLRYLPSAAPEGTESGVSQRKAEAMCRRLVAVHCLYGVDKNPLAVELAKLAVWLESHAEGLPLTFLDHRFVIGDSLTGPFWQHLLTSPGAKQQVTDLFRQNLDIAFRERLCESLDHVRDLENSVGVTEAEVTQKQAAKDRLDRAMLPFRIIAAAWAGGVMLGDQGCDDAAYSSLVRSFAEVGELPDVLDSQRLRAMIARGLGVGAVSQDRDHIYQQMLASRTIPALAYDLWFPEVFYPLGMPFTRRGFDVVLGNPPWDKVMPASKEFFARYDFSIVAAAAKADRELAEELLKAQPPVRKAFDCYWGMFAQDKRVFDRLYNWQNVEVEGERSGAQPDYYRYFSERGLDLARDGGGLGWVLPSSFHANEGATGIRQLYLEHAGLRKLLSFENRLKLFEIDSRMKFDLVLAEKASVSTQVACRFGMLDDQSLFSNENERLVLYSRAFIEKTGGAYLTFVELENRRDSEVLGQCVSAAATSLRKLLEKWGIVCGEELNKTRQSVNFRRSDKLPRREPVFHGKDTTLPVYEGHNIWQYDDQFGAGCDYCFPMAKLVDRPDLARLAPFYRFGYRLIAGATNERTLVAAIIRPGCVCTQSISIERKVTAPRFVALALVGLWNSFLLDWQARQRVAATVNKFLLEAIPIPSLIEIQGFLSHGALRLCANHSGYATLWREQLGEAWHEDGRPRHTWPALPNLQSRWHLQSSMDAVIAHAYGLSPEDYRHVLAGFNHEAQPFVPEMCLRMLDEIRASGVARFIARHDPYNDTKPHMEDPRPAVSLGRETNDGLFPEDAQAHVKRRKRRP